MVAGTRSPRHRDSHLDRRRTNVDVHRAHPSRLLRHAPTPLVLNLHGSGSNATQQELSPDERDRRRDTFIVVYPQAVIPSGAGFVWNIPGVPLIGGSGVPAGAANDETYLEAVVASMRRTACIDTEARRFDRLLRWRARCRATRVRCRDGVRGRRAGERAPAADTVPGDAGRTGDLVPRPARSRRSLQRQRPGVLDLQRAHGCATLGRARQM